MKKNTIINEKKVSQKKLVTFKNSELVNKLISIEASAQSTSDSVVVENSILEHFLNSNTFIADYVASNITQSNGVVKTMIAINNMCIDKPELVNDSYLEILHFLKNQIVKYEMPYEEVTPALLLLKERTDIVLDIIQETLDADPYYQYYVRDENIMRGFNKLDNIGFRDISKLDHNESVLQEKLIYLAFNDIIQFWDFKDNLYESTLKHSKSIYMLIDAALRICELPDFENIKYEFLLKLKKLSFETSPKKVFNEVEYKLNNRIFIKNKSFKTTEDAIILRSNPHAIDTEFTSAYRVINGPGSQMTRKPFIILFQDESDEDRIRILKELIKDYPEDFPSPEQVYYVQFLWEGEYYDKRICWITI